jgi:hypothetical protein
MTGADDQTRKEKPVVQRHAASHLYEPPQLEVLGTLQELTKENFQNPEVDFNQSGIELTGVS